MVRANTVFAIFLIIIGLTTNVYIVSHVFSPDGKISSNLLRVVIWIWDISCMSCGVVLLKYRHLISLRTIKPSYLIYLGISTTIALCVAEAALRILGYGSWHDGRLGTTEIRVDGEKHYSVVDSVLGHTIIPGLITITMPTGLRFSATHCHNRSRATHLPSEEMDQPEIWTLGCSFTYGWGVDDSGSYPWKLKKRLPGYEVVNFGVSGYGTLQTLMWFQRNMKTLDPPLVAILGYVPWHDERNVLARSWKKNLAAYEELAFMEHPFGFLDDDGHLCVARATIHYTGLPLIQYSAFMNLLDDFVNKIDLKRRSGIELTAAILDSFSISARRAGTVPVIAFMMDDPISRKLFMHCGEYGIRSIDISVDLGSPENTLLPLDPHPSAHAHRQYADKLYEFLIEEKLIDPQAEPSVMIHPIK